MLKNKFEAHEHTLAFQTALCFFQYCDFCYNFPPFSRRNCNRKHLKNGKAISFHGRDVLSHS